jgi:hypothetical protein
LRDRDGGDLFGLRLFLFLGLLARQDEVSGLLREA